MISFFVSGHPEAQGSMTPFCPVSPNADINEAAEYLRAVAVVDAMSDSPVLAADADDMSEVADRLDAIGKWPAYQKHGPEAKTPGHFVATMHASNATKLNKWRKAIAMAARDAAPGGPIAKAGLQVDIIYRFRRPKNHYRTGKFSAMLRDDCPAAWDHFVKPDRDKLNRAVGDALTGIIFVDDSQDCTGTSSKRWNDSRDEPEGAEITITRRLSE